MHNNSLTTIILEHVLHCIMIQISVGVNHSNECTDALHQIPKCILAHLCRIPTTHVVLNQDTSSFARGPDSDLLPPQTEIRSVPTRRKSKVAAVPPRTQVRGRRLKLGIHSAKSAPTRRQSKVAAVPPRTQVGGSRLKLGTHSTTASPPPDASRQLPRYRRGLKLEAAD